MTLSQKLEKIGSDPKATARFAGLRYASGHNGGYRRLGKKDHFRYVDDEENAVHDKAVMERIRKLVIPPAWENVWISPFENGHLQVTGTDARGRKQYRYHPQWNKVRNQSKFFRLRHFAHSLPKIRKQVEKDLNRKKLDYNKVLAIVVKLIEMTNIRIGNDAYKRLYGSFGLTTLRDRHVKFDKSKLYFEFIGKKGVRHSIGLASRKMANLVRKCKDIPGQELFQYYDADGKRHSIGSADVNHYIKEITGEDFTAKDFRAWAGSVNALCGFQQAGDFSSVTECRKKVVAVIDSVAEKLGNTRSVCKKYYIDPTVIATYENGDIGKYPPPKKCRPGMNPEEAALVRLLEKENIAEVIA